MQASSQAIFIHIGYQYLKGVLLVYQSLYYCFAIILIFGLDKLIISQFCVIVTLLRSRKLGIIAVKRSIHHKEAFMQRSNFFWGIVIVAIGAILLLEPLGIVPEGINITKFIWPAALISLGIWFLLVPVLFKGRTFETETLSIPIEDAKNGRIRLKHGAGKLVVGASSKPDTLLSGTFLGGIEHSLRRKDDVVKLKLRTHIRGFRITSFGRFEGLN